MDDSNATAFHSLTPSEALARLDATPNGLSTAQAGLRLTRYGRNRLPEIRGKTVLGIVLHQFQSPFIYLLLAAAMLSVVLGHLTDAGFIAIVLLLNALIGAYQEWRAETRARALKTLLHGRIPTRRDNFVGSLDIELLVPGDIVQLESGLKVPADLRLLQAEALVTDESLLTGESLPVEKEVEAQIAADAPLGNRRTALFAGSTIRSGRGLGLVVATGRHTEVGRLAQALTRQAVPPPLIARMAQFTRQISVAALVLIALIAALEFLRGSAPAEILLLAIALAVSAIPEGLPVAMTVALSISVHRMGLRNVVVRHLPAVEGLGACTMIATDKTGTLTVNRLSVETLWLPAQGRLAPHHPMAAPLALAAARCSESHGLDFRHADHRGEEIGDAVDLAFLRLAAHFDYDAALDAAGHRGRIAYEPQRRYAADFLSDGDVLIAYVKGAPETVLALCGSESWSAEQRTAADRAVQDLAAAGFRVIAVAAGPVTEPEAESLDGLTLLGFAGLIDPLRKEAQPAIRAARDAGIGVVMVTGDHPLTAFAIARDLDLVADTAKLEDAVATGAQLRLLEDDEAAFDAAVARACIFARIEPLQKLAIVQSLRRRGEVVAVTGDGVNDAAALQAADIGVAMGRAGTDVAREAADLILVDDNFASIVAGIEEGRAAYDNLRKVILLCISTGAAEILLMLLATLMGLPPPLTAIQLIWLNLVTNGIQDVALAFEKAEPGLLRRRPRPAKAAIFDRRMIEQVLLSAAVIGSVSFAVYAYGLQTLALEVTVAQGLTLWLMVWFENMQVLNNRSETRSLFRIPLANNPLLILGVLAAQGLQFAAAFLPGIGPLLRLEALDLRLAALLALPAFGLILVIELYKGLRRSSAA